MADGMTIEFEGWDQFQVALNGAGPLAARALASALYSEMEQIISNAQTRTPVDTGVLRASGTTLPPTIDGPTVEVTGGFGGAASAYSIPVHERLGVHHTVGEAKFLEKAADERAPKIGENVARKVGEAMTRLRAG